MTLDPVSVAVGVVAAYVFSAVLFVALCLVELRQERKERDEAVNRMLANVALRCIEHPIDVRSN